MTQNILKQLDNILEQRKTASPDESYTAKLLHSGVDQVLKKIGEEATETIIASKTDVSEDIIHEVADLWFHTIVLLKYHGLSCEAVLDELESRFGLSGIEEKANRDK